ncbi:MAG TPA: MFS transporter, partial [Solirubrobacteraceae bacterium]
IGLAAILLTETKLANVAATDPQPIDWGGLVTFTLALFGLIFGLIRGNSEGWGSAQILASFGIAAAGFVAFWVIESRRRGAMLDLSLFRMSSFGGVSIVAWAISASMFSMFLYQTLYIQDVLGYTPLQAGVRFLPTTLVTFAVSPIAANLSNRFPVRAIMGLGLLLVSAGLFLMHGVQPGDSWTGLLPGFIVGGAGVGMANPMIAETALGVVPARRAGMASGINSTFRQFGIATGVAGLGAIFSSRIGSELAGNLSNAPAAVRGRSGQLADAVSSGAIHQALGHVPPAARGAIKHAADASFITAFNEILLISGFVALAGAVLGFLLVRKRDFVGVPQAQPAPEAPETAAEPVPAG